MTRLIPLLVLRISFLLSLFSNISAKSFFNQSSDYRIIVNLDTWSNQGDYGGCVTCPYTCVKPSVGPDGKEMNISNSTFMSSIPQIYSEIKSNGCCFAKKGLSKQQPSCSTEAEPKTAEDCGFLSGPTLDYTIFSKPSDPKADIPFTKPMLAILFASVDCEHFWAVGFNYVRQVDSTGRIKGSQIINSGCYGASTGGPIVLAGCLTNQLKFDKSSGYTWQQLAQKCRGLSGKCGRTNGLWGLNLKCCRNRYDVYSDWDLHYEVYEKAGNARVPLPDLAITAIVFAGVAFMMLLVHCGAKVRHRAIATALLREQEATDDYDEIITPLTSDQQYASISRRPNIHVPASITVSLHEGDEIYRPPKDEVLYEGDMY